MAVVSAFLVSGSPLPMLKPENPAWAGLAAGFARAREALVASNPDVLLVYSTQWIAVLDELWQVRARSKGVHVDENWYEFGDLPFDIRADVALAKACVAGCAGIGVSAKPVDYEDFPIDTGTIVADTLLNPGRLPLVIAANNVYHDFVTTERLAAMAAATAQAQGKRVAVVAVGGLSGAYFDHSIDIAEDHVRHAADDAANRAFLEALGRGSDAARAAVADYAGAVKADFGMKHLAWVLGATGGFSGATVHGYGATYGAGAAVVEFRL
jgi:2-aminophenol/2-amino-5-chlorophenol 1,6-dioxygenase alpha subunit